MTTENNLKSISKLLSLLEKKASFSLVIIKPEMTIDLNVDTHGMLLFLDKFFMMYFICTWNYMYKFTSRYIFKFKYSIIWIKEEKDQIFIFI